MAREHAVNSIRDFDLRISDFGGGAEPVTDLPPKLPLGIPQLSGKFRVQLESGFWFYATILIQGPASDRCKFVECMARGCRSIGGLDPRLNAWACFPVAVDAAKSRRDGPDRPARLQP